MAAEPTKSKNYAPVRSVRVDNATWEMAAKRAEKDGLTMSTVMLRFIEGYATGHLAAPRMEMVYSSPEE